MADQIIQFCRSPDGVRIAYATSGTGPPLVRAPNWLTNVDLDWRSPIWSHWFEALSERNTLVRYDIRGSGLSDRVAEDLSLESWVRDLETVVDELQLERFPIMGICQGGATAITYAVRHPERVTGLILYGSYAQGPYVIDDTSFTQEEAEALTQMIKIGWGENRPAFRQTFTHLLIPEATKEEQDWLNEIQRRTVSPETAAYLFQQFLHIDVAHLARKVQVPTLVMHSRNDNMVAFNDGPRLASLIPHARFVTLESNNHILRPSEPAWSRFIEEIRGFLAPLSDEYRRATLGAEFDELTPREHDVLELIAQGLRNEAIAEYLCVATKTIRNHVTSIYAKLGVETRAEAIVRSREAGYGHSQTDA
jgi:pimeloyl-ACP methyl ester carboxylesterase/DNA-binding CsgD family transcriptional regulator